MPGYGRLEIQPPANRLLPQPAESYHESWSARSTPQAAEVPLYPPAVIMAPRGGNQRMPQNMPQNMPSQPQALPQASKKIP
jgi:hypothetical protein